VKRKSVIVLAAMLITSLFMGQPASAAGKSTSCAAFFCAFSVSGFPGGTISVDADARQAPSPPSDRTTAYWRIWGNNGYSCGTGFAETALMQSWVCHNVPAGTVFAAIEGTPYMAMGVRW
jgi:hypothetical protein